MEELENIMRKIREKTPLSPCDVNQVALFDTGHVACLFGRSVGRAIIELCASGCEWALRSGGCTMCGHIAVTTRGRRVSSGSYIKQMQQVIEKHDFRKTPVVCIYNSGSFFNDKEISPKARKGILKILSENVDIKKVIIESRIEFVIKEKVNEMQNILGDKIIEVGIGLESSNDEIRKICIHKGFTLKEFEKRANKIKDIVDLLIYVLIKPPFLTEKEGIEDAIRSAEYAFGLSAKAVSFEPVSIQPYTLVNLLDKYKLWRISWLWSVIEVAKATHSLAQNMDAEIRLGGYEYLPRPVLTAYNGINKKICRNCNDKVKEAIIKYNGTYDISVFDTLSCNCKNDWKKELEVKAPPLRERVRMNLLTLNKYMQNMNNSTMFKIKSCLEGECFYE